MANVGRKPDFQLSAKLKINQDAKGRVGAAWEQEDGSIQIKLDPFVCLQGEGISGEAMWLTLYPNKPRETLPADKIEEGNAAAAAAGRKPAKVDDLEDDIPF